VRHVTKWPDQQLHLTAAKLEACDLLVRPSAGSSGVSGTSLCRNIESIAQTLGITLAELMEGL
jgi:hypothetical protein